jgi:hypothetical protein
VGYYIYHKRGRSREEEEGYPNRAVADKKKKTKAQRHADVKTDSPSRQNVSKISKVFRDASRSLRVYDDVSPLPLDVYFMA